MTATPLCPACQRPVTSGEAVCFHCRAVLDPFTSGARIADRYVIEENIGQGGMGRVYRAYDEALHEKVAIKTLLAEFSTNPTFLTRFRDEVRLARRVAHPNVCRVHDYVDHGGTPFLSMEWVEGETLAARLKRLGARPETELQVVLRDVTEALRALWSNGIVHRDLKPANLMWTRAGQVKVMDFGLARALVGAGDRDRTSGVIGSPEYLSPEQIRGESATEKSDTYALGVTLFELTTGHPPFHGVSPAQTLMKHLSDRPDASALASVSEGLRSLILRSLDKNPAARPELRAETDRTRVETKGVQVAETPKTRTMTWAASLAGLASVIAIARYFGLGSPSPPNVPKFAPSAASPVSSPLPSATVSVRTEPIPALSRTAGSAPPPDPSPPAISNPRPVSETPPPGVETASESGTAYPRSGALARPTPAPALPETPMPGSNAPTPPPPAVVPGATLAAAPAHAVDARLVVVATPWAEVFVDGDRKGLTPLPALVVPPGSHIVELRHPDFRPFRRTIELKSGEQIRLSVNLRLEAIRR